jgi:hypothetical protein
MNAVTICGNLFVAMTAGTINRTDTTSVREI